jgi:hypothetical protein
MLGGWLRTSNNGHKGTGEQQQTTTEEDDDDHPGGLSHEFLFGILPRLCGGDVVIFPNAGGRFQFSLEACQDVAEGCRRPMGRFQGILPCPAGGMKLHRVEEMRQTFGDDTLLLIGGSLFEQGDDLELDAQLFAHNAGRDRPYSPVPPLSGTSSSNSSITASDDKNNNHNQETTTKPKLLGKLSKLPQPYFDVRKCAYAVRRRVLEYTLRNNGGYLSQACSSADTLATLYLRGMKLGPPVSPSVPGPFRGSPSQFVETITGEGYNGDITDPSLDRFIFSPVHYALVLYALLVECGRLDIAAFKSFNQDGSTVELIGAEHSPGHAVTAGSLA